MIWRRRNIYYKFSPSLFCLPSWRPFMIPYVFTYVYSRNYTIYNKYRAFLPWLKISFLIKNSIVWQIYFMVYPFDFSLVQNGSGVVNGIFFISKTNNSG